MNRNEARQLLGRLDWMQVISAGLLLIIGVFFIYSAGFQRADLPVHSFHNKQLLWIVVGVVCFLAVALLDYHVLAEYSGWIFVAAIVMLIAVFFIGVNVRGAYRWLNVFGMNLQPSELAKLATLLSLAGYVSRPGIDINRLQHLMGALLIVGIPFTLIALEPDLGTAMVLVPLALVVLFAAGLSWRILGMLAAIGLFVLLPLGWLSLEDYQKERVLVFFDSDIDPQGAGWNKEQSKIAVGSGGTTGKGYLKGTQNILGFLPRSVAPTDFIFSVIAEEMGFMGSALVLVLYCALLLSITRAAIRARDRLGRFLVVGVLGMMFAHIFVNIAMTVGLLPITGLPLPLISYGGSFMMSTMIALGITQSVFMRRRQR